METDKMKDNGVYTNTAVETKDGYAAMEAVLPRCSKEEVSHTHPLQTIELEALEGKLGIILPDRRLIIRPGRPFEIPRNMEHAFYNAGDRPVRFKSKLKPALHTEWLTKEIGAARRRKQPAIVSLMEHLYILSLVRGEYYRSDLPVVLQKLLRPLIPVIARLLGIDKRVGPVY